MSAATSVTSTGHDGAIPHIAALMRACFNCFGFTTAIGYKKAMDLMRPVIGFVPRSPSEGRPDACERSPARINFVAPSPRHGLLAASR
jgi:hypothetical protein